MSNYKTMCLMNNIPKNKKRDWKIYIDDFLLNNVKNLRIFSNFGEVTYGLTPEGYDG